MFAPVMSTKHEKQLAHKREVDMKNMNHQDAFAYKEALKDVEDISEGKLQVYELIKTKIRGVGADNKGY